MPTFPETRESLIASLHDRADKQAWEQFTQLYRPVIYRLARARGIQDADAQDVTQQILISVADAVGRWEKQNEQVRFRHWLRRIARNAIINALTRAPKDRASGGTTVGNLLAQQSAQVTDQEIELEYRRELYLSAAEKVKNEVDLSTWQAFELSVVQDLPVKATANQLKQSLGSVYAARSRVMRRLREIVQKLEETENEI